MTLHKPRGSLPQVGGGFFGGPMGKEESLDRVYLGSPSTNGRHSDTFLCDLDRGRIFGLGGGATRKTSSIADRCGSI